MTTPIPVRQPLLVRKSPCPVLFLVYVSLASAAFGPATAAARTWTDATGKHQIEADYVGFSDGIVKLRKSDQSVVEVPLERLSDRDRAYVKRQVSSGGDAGSATDVAGDGLEKQLSLSYEKPFAVFPPNDQQPLFATIELTGAAAAKTTHYGFLEIASAELNEQRVLEQIESSFSMTNPVDQFVEADRQRMFAGQFEKPDDKLRIHFMLQRPPSDAGRLQVLEGKLQLITGGQRKELTVPAIAQQTGQSLSDPVLSDAGLQIEVVDPAQAKVTVPDATPEQMVSLVIRGPETAILDMELVDRQGDALETTAAWTGGGSGTPLFYTLQADQTLPRDAGFRLRLAVGQQRVHIPFRFEDVRLPAGEGTTTARAVRDAGGSQPVASRDRQRDASAPEAIDKLRARLNLRGHIKGVNSVAFSPDGRQLATAGEGGAIKVWNVKTGRASATCAGHQGPVRDIAFSPDGRLLASTSNDKTVRLWDPRSGRQIRVVRGHWNSVLSADFSPDGSRLATGGRDWTVRLWEVDTGRELGTLKGHIGWVHSVAFGPDGRWLASATPRPQGRDSGGEVILWDLQSEVPTQITYGEQENVEITSRKIQAKMTDHKLGAESVVFFPTGSGLITGSRRGETVRMWKVPSGEQVAQLKSVAGPIALSPAGRLLAVGSGRGEVELRSMATRKQLISWQGHQGNIRSLEFSPAGTALATAGQDKVVRVWAVPSASDIHE